MVIEALRCTIPFQALGNLLGQYLQIWLSRVEHFAMVCSTA
jgi:hypothetical protein